MGQSVKSLLIRQFLFPIPKNLWGPIASPPPHLPLFPPTLKCVQSNPFYNAHHRKGGTTTPRKNTQLEICNRHAKHWNDDEMRYIFGAIKLGIWEKKSFGDFSTANPSLCSFYVLGRFLRHFCNVLRESKAKHCRNVLGRKN